MNTLKTINEFGDELTIELLFNFEIKELNKNYVVYTLNDDGVSEDVNVLISEIYYEGDIPRIKSIDESEKEMVVIFYNDIKNSIVNQ